MNGWIDGKNASRTVDKDGKISSYNVKAYSRNLVAGMFQVKNGTAILTFKQNIKICI